jgi:hypothetical protein
MKPMIPLGTLAFSVLCVTSAIARTTYLQTDEAGASTKLGPPVAYVYVTNVTNPDNPNFSIYNIYAYATAANGKLTLVPGSPFNDNVWSSLAVNSKYLFGGEGLSNLVTFEIEADGALKKVATTDTASFQGKGVCLGGGVGPEVDHSGAFLYNFVDSTSCQGDNVQFYSIQSATGKLDYLGQSPTLLPVSYEIRFTGTDAYVFAPVYCQDLAPNQVSSIYAFQRPKSGKLNLLYHEDMDASGVSGLGPMPPSEPGGGNSYCPFSFAPDPTDHVAALLVDTNNDGVIYGNPAIATYTVGADGKLTTTSTRENMAFVSPSIFNGIDTSSLSMRMSPSGKLLAVGADGGLELYHFNGASPATEFEILLAGEYIDGEYWDSNNHLYVLAGNGTLHVYTATPTSIVEAPGSPYSIPDPANLIVQSR